MPITYKTRLIEAEQRVAERVRELREAKGLSYHALAAQMKAVGCEIYPSAIQKTEKAGRRITVDELVGYARALNVSINELLGQNPQTEKLKESQRQAHQNALQFLDNLRDQLEHDHQQTMVNLYRNKGE
ncbi:helix-turn-helix transcriptional regulator [Auritidibacter ignavus]|uniref:Helix-turn-helix transcriptional regulator n=1 Tax=Auritidibacter ignavus TaxID=678932 RepID=A0AAJ6AIE5_9MICC|nr:helix-turn-helix transcriptional regulator [Auritidibacter ignavus]WGH91435.1 helix-turn-helix transcriptional regulator [Auritidibacter ignavus]WGH93860.1 helix-turn-helix transcriptional regulator [Auritidibacter ignavus]